MTEVLSNETGSGSGDEGSASGGGHSPDEKPQRKASMSGKSFCNNILNLTNVGTKPLR